MDEDQQNAPPAPGEPISLGYQRRPGLWRIAIVNAVLGLLTLGIYRFWAKTNVRRHIWSSVQINEQPLEYTGTGKELFFGFLVIFAVLILPIILIGVALTLIYGPEHWSTIVFQIVVTFGVVTLYGFAIYRARRYRLSRTLWRGIRGALTGSALAYSAKYFGSLILRSMTMGWSTPAMNLLLSEQMTRDMRFGDHRFDFRGRAGPLYARYALCWFATLLVLVPLIGVAGFGLYAAFGDTLAGLFSEVQSEDETGQGMAVAALVAVLVAFIVLYAVLSSTIWTFYTARELNLFADYTSFGPARFAFNATPWSLITLWLGNIAILILSFGVGRPIVEQRVMEYFCNRLTVDGLVDIAAIGQSRAPLDKRGEGMVDAFDLDAFG